MVIGQGYMNSFSNPYMMGMNPYMSGSYLNFKDNKDMQAYLSSSVDDAQSSIYASGQGRVSQRAGNLARQLKSALLEENDTEVRDILESVQGDKHATAGLELAYDQLSNSRCALRTDIREGMEGSKFMEQIGLGGVYEFIHHVKASVLKPLGLNPMSQREAIDILNEGAEVSTDVAANALKDATALGLGTDKKTINEVLAHSNGRMNEIEASYQPMGNLFQDVSGAYSRFVDGFGAQERITRQIVRELA